jgi:hypothetical protein
MGLFSEFVSHHTKLEARRTRACRESNLRSEWPLCWPVASLCVYARISVGCVGTCACVHMHALWWPLLTGIVASVDW